MSKNLRNFANKKVLAFLVVAVVILALVGSSTSLSSLSYSTAYEGAKCRFVGVKDLATNQIYTNTQPNGASIAWFSTDMNFDVDHAKGGKPNVAGEMTSVFIPRDSVTSVPSDWVPSTWWRDALSWNNPTKTYEWSIKNSDSSSTLYHMEEWKTKWYVSLSAEWDLQGDEYYTALGVPPNTEWGQPEQRNQRLNDLQVWFEFDLQPTWYFEGADTARFAIAKVELSHINYGEQTHEGASSPYDVSKPRITPMSPGAVVTIYQNAFGSLETEEKSSFEALYYQNAKLNPNYFRDKVYGYITLNDFGTQEWWDYVTLKAHGDVVTFGFTVTQFVVGEWKVQDIDDIDEDDFGRTAKFWESGWVGFSNFVEWMGTPVGQFWLFFILIAATLIVIAIFAPQTFLIFGSIIRNLTSNSGGQKR